MIKKFGYYKIGELITPSKIEAIELHHKTGIHPEWIFNDAEFSCYNWKIEPNESLEDLYLERVKQLRKKYDYLVLFYSGGADSTNILHTFINNNILLDEAISYHMEKGSHKNDYGQIEINRAAVPEIQRMQKIDPRLKYRNVDISELTWKYFGNKKNKFDLIYDINDSWSPHHLGLTEIKNYVDDWQRIADAGKKIGFIHGIDKPKVQIDDKGYHLKFLDILISSNIDVKIINDDFFGDHHELFYWSPDMPKIAIKQAHIIKNYVEKNKENLKIPEGAKPNTNFQTLNHQYRIPNETLNKLIYPSWNSSTFTLGKHQTPVLSPRDNWFLQYKNTEEYKIYQMSLQAISQITGNDWLNGHYKLELALNGDWIKNVTTTGYGLKGIWSKSYYI